MAQRHQALKGWIAGVLVLGIFASISPQSSAAPNLSPIQEIQLISQQLEKSHGLHLIWENIENLKGESVTFEAIGPQDESRLLAFLRVFQEEIDRYPAGFFKPSGLTRVFLVKKLFKGTYPAHGAYLLPMGYMYFDI